MISVEFCPFRIRQTLYIHHTVTNLAVFAQYTVCCICSTCYITTSIGMCSTNTLKCLLSNDEEKGEYVIPRITIVILCLAALPCGDVISFLCSVCKYIISLAPTIMVVFPSKVYCILHYVQRTWHEDSTMTTGGGCIAIHMDTHAEKCRSQEMGLSCD